VVAFRERLAPSSLAPPPHAGSATAIAAAAITHATSTFRNHVRPHAVRSVHQRPCAVPARYRITPSAEVEMSKLLRGLAAGYGAKKLGGGCISTVLIFILLWWLLGNFGVFQ
jgi:hypothetical protein